MTVRRLLAALLIPIFIGLFLASVLALRVNSTAFEPEFYSGVLEEAGTIDFVYDVGIPEVMREAEESWGFSFEDDLPLGLGLTPGTAPGLVEEALPREWVAENVNRAIVEVVPYFGGETDSFEVTIPINERVDEAEAVARRLLREAELHTFLIEAVVRPAAEAEAESDGLLANLPYGVEISAEDVVEGFRTVVPKAWLMEQAEAALDEAAPYVVGREESFEVTVLLQDRGDVAVEVIEGWLLRSLGGGAAHEHLLNERIAPVVRETLGLSVVFPWGVQVTDTEIVGTIARVLPPEWVAKQVSQGVDAIGPYLTGRTDGFVLVIPLDDRLDAARGVLADAVDAKLEAVYERLSVCTAAQLLDGSLAPSETPPCRPPLLSYDAFKEVAGLDVSEQTKRRVIDPLPAEITLDEEDLFGDAEEIDLNRARELMRDGYTFSDADLLDLLEQEAGPEAVELFLDARTRLRDGFTFDEGDISDLVDADAFDQARGYVRAGRSALLLLLVATALIGVAIGLLGSKRRLGRLGWAGAALLAAGVLSGVILFVVEANLSAVVAEQETLVEQGMSELMAMELSETARTAVNAFVGPAVWQSLLRCSSRTRAGRAGGRQRSAGGHWQGLTQWRSRLMKNASLGYRERSAGQHPVGMPQAPSSGRRSSTHSYKRCP